jgi:hypothetical protein
VENKSYKPSKKLTTADGTIMYTFDGKLHNWEGPALIPEGNNRRTGILYKWNQIYGGEVERNSTKQRGFALV